MGQRTWKTELIITCPNDFYITPHKIILTGFKISRSFHQWFAVQNENMIGCHMIRVFIETKMTNRHLFTSAREKQI